MTIQSERPFSGAKFNNASRNNWKPLFEVNLVRILLKQLDYSLSKVINRNKEVGG